MVFSGWSFIFLFFFTNTNVSLHTTPDVPGATPELSGAALHRLFYIFGLLVVIFTTKSAAAPPSGVLRMRVT